MFFKKKTVTNTNVINYTEQDKRNDTFYGQVLNSIRAAFGRGGGTFGISASGKRNYNELFGYGTNLDYRDYHAMYERGGYAKTIVDLFPKSCWRDTPELKLNDTTILESELESLKHVGLFKALETADVCNRIGKFSVLFIGIPDGLDPSLPVGSAASGDFAGLYFQAFEEDGIEVVKWDTDPSSRRYNMPDLYQLQVVNRDNSKLQGDITARVVHHSRIVHMAEGALSNKLEGVSCLKACWNALQDKEKVRGAAGESYYRNSRQKLSLESLPGASQKPLNDAQREQLKENVENFQNGFEDTLRLSNMTANMMQPQIASPRDTFDISTEDIAGTCRIPVRFLTTKTGGSVTGSEDKAALNAVVNDRQEQECTIWLLDSLKAIAESGIFVLPEFISVSWPVQSSLSEKESAESSKARAEAFKSATEGLSTIGGDSVIAESVFKEIGLDIETDDIDLSIDDEKESL